MSIYDNGYQRDHDVDSGIDFDSLERNHEDSLSCGFTTPKVSIPMDQDVVKDARAFKQTLRVLSRKAEAVLHSPVKVTEAHGDAVAYTMDRGDKTVVPIAISRTHSFYEGATAEEGAVLRLGLTCHEVMHQVMTPFEYVKHRELKMDKRTASVFHLMHNVLEDPAIEHFCPQFIGGQMKTALKYTIKWGYDHGPELGHEQTAWQQYINAMIQYGDMGPLRGRFTFPEAQQAFMDTVDLFSQGIREPDGKKRVRIAAQLTEATRALWDTPDMDNGKGGKGSGDGSPGSSGNAGNLSLEELKELINEILKNRGDQDLDSPGIHNDPQTPTIRVNAPLPGKGNRADSNDGPVIDLDIDDLDESIKDQMRKALVESIKEANKAAGNGSQGAEQEKDGNGEHGDSSDKSSGEKSGEDVDSNMKDSKQQQNSSRDDRQKGTPVHQVDQAFHKVDQSSGNNNNNVLYDADDDLSSFDKLLQEAALEAETESLSSIAESLKPEEMKPENMNMDPIPDRLTTIPAASSYSCYNQLSAEGDIDDYLDLTRELQPQIQSLVQSLTQLFKSDEDDTRLYTRSGRYDLRRHVSPRVTPYMFTREREPGDKRDMCVGICIDHSGSMGGSRIDRAGKAAIVIAEACAQLNIPCYVMGYTTGSGADAKHTHYVRWSNTQTERYRLANIRNSAFSGNFDCYSIAYMADEIMDKQQAEHKIMMVISDGLPTGDFTGNGVEDVRSVVTSAKQRMDVVGICINSDEYSHTRNGESLKQDFAYMYGNGFCDATNVNRLPTTLSRSLEDIVANW